MEEDYIVLNKWDIEDLIGNSGCAVVDDYRILLTLLSSVG